MQTMYVDGHDDCCIIDIMFSTLTFRHVNHRRASRWGTIYTSHKFPDSLALESAHRSMLYVVTSSNVMPAYGRVQRHISMFFIPKSNLVSWVVKRWER